MALQDKMTTESFQLPDTESPDAGKSFTQVIYDAIKDAFASSNPKQLLALNWPGTVLDYERLKWEEEEAVSGNMPERSLVRTSQILDVFVPPSPITQPDGTRVSDRYANALASYGPKPNASLLELQRVIRDRMHMEITRVVDGKEQSYTLVNWFNYLYTQWTQAKEAWSAKQTDQQEKLLEQYKEDEEKYWNAYLAWYEENADSYIQEINSKWDQLLIEFPLNEWNDAIAILDTHDDGGLNVAKTLMNNVRLPLPRQEGIDYVPSTAIPYDWPLELQPVTKHIDLLSDPLAQKQTLDNQIKKLQDEVFNWMAILPQVKNDDGVLQEHAKAFHDAVHDYGQKQSELLTQYSENALTAVRCFCDVQASRQKPLGDLTDKEQTKAQGGIQNLIKTLDIANVGGKAAGTAVGMPDWEQIKKIAGEIAQGQESLIGKQQNLIDAGYTLANAANDYLKDSANTTQMPWLYAYVTTLNTKIQDLQAQNDKLAAAANVYVKYLNADGNDPSADPAESPKFADNAFPTSLDVPAGDRWTQVTITLDESSMSSNTTMSTYFEQDQWGVDFFFGSYGSSSQRSSSFMSSNIMKSGSSIQIAFLATKVLIERPWMKPEVFANSGTFFRTMEKPLAPEFQVTQDMLLDGGNETVKKMVSDYVLPCYPVAMLLAKDVTIKVQVDASRTSDVRTMAKSIKSQGGGFLCFSISSTEASQSQSESMNSFCMAGQFVAKAPAPQILAYWLQFLPPDKSTKLDQETANQIAQAIGFVTKLQAIYASTKEFKERPVALR